MCKQTCPLSSRRERDVKPGQPTKLSALWRDDMAWCGAVPPGITHCMAGRGRSTGPTPSVSVSCSVHWLVACLLACLLYVPAACWGQYHGGRRPSSDDSFHSPTVNPPSAFDKPCIMIHYHTLPFSAEDGVRCNCTFTDDGNAS